MVPLAWTVFLCFVSSARSGDAIYNETASATPTIGSFSGYALEMLMVKLDHMQQSVLQLQIELAKQREEVAQSKAHMTVGLDQMQQSFLGLQSELAKHREEAADIGNAKTGAYMIQANDESKQFLARCQRDMQAVGIWLVIQFRFDGSLDFYRNWTEYRNGFGHIKNEFWIGLERIHQLTSGRPHELMVELRNFRGNYKFALYSAFEIGNETEQYNLKTLGAYHGTAGDSLSHQKNMKFSTYDRDNDMQGLNCAEIHEGAWWYNLCSQSNLNGPYKNTVDSKSINWYHFSNSHEGLSFSRMMIRPK
ncbi:fibrinogen-like protein A [Anopheles cruzii]|uniref:fibrinogen-like protein A n=1 Tax=Anopheles cruzii TaxID=68878 RepID=UPI0022EC7EF6|nr:fibrinogen-like protein A [Anopheles cruzii]